MSIPFSDIRDRWMTDPKFRGAYASMKDREMDAAVFYPHSQGALWLTYAEISAALGISQSSARRLVTRNKSWPRKIGHDTLARIAVPIERIEEASKPKTERALLVAAAADMQAALKQAQAALNPMSGMVKKHRAGGPEDRFLESARDAIRAALAKARGE
jgi:hypothetical protein